MKALPLALLLLLPTAVRAQQPDSSSGLQELRRKLEQAEGQVDQLTRVIKSIREEVSRIEEKSVEGTKPAASGASRPATESPQAPRAETAEAETARSDFARRMIDPDLGSSTRDHKIAARPEIFIQARFSARPIRDSGSEFEPNFGLTRVETEWAGRVAERVGAGLEIQFHEALAGAPEQLVNDAYIEYYLSDHATVRMGQFIKPFGFEIQQSSSIRESPERGMFAGYFFPGQRDRGVLLFGDLDSVDSRALRNVRFYVAALNGNRFFSDNNRQLNIMIRARKLFDHPRLAFGVSMQRGKQILPDGVRGNNDENLIGVDFQYASGRFGFRGEWVAGNTPSTLLSIRREFAPAFRPGAHSSGGYFFAGYQLTSRDSLYARYDQFNGDPVSGRNVRAVNFGYQRKIGEFSRLGFDYQVKNRPSFNDDAVNGRFHITWGMMF